MRNCWRWALQGLLVLLALEGMALLAAMRGVLPGWHDPLTAVILITALAVVLYKSVAGTAPGVGALSQEEEIDGWLRFHMQETIRFASWPRSAREQYLALARRQIGSAWQPRCLLYEEEGCVANAEPGSAFCRTHQPTAPDEATPSPPLALAD